jgi:SAM-dependent methyltransferase
VKYFKNTELARIYNVSEKSIRNWIQAASEGKLDLELHDNQGRQHIINTSKNTALIEQLVLKGKKYKNTRSHKVVEPTAKFYELYSPEQVFDIVTNIDIYKEVPRQYNYFDGGAEYWDRYTNRLASEETPNILKATLELFSINQSYLDTLTEKYTQINIIDIGVGNAYPVKNLLEHLLSRKKLGRYIAVDISSEMLGIARRNIETWFDKDEVTFEGHELDINYDRFAHLLVNEYIKQDHDDTLNIILVLGGTLGNLRSPDSAFKAIHDSMTRNDMLITTHKLDTPTTRRYFDFNIDTKTQPLAPQYKFIVDLLNIDSSYYTVEMDYDEADKARFLRIRFNVALSIKFTFQGGERVIEINKDETLLMWRYWHQEALDVAHQLDGNGFHPLLMSQTEDRDYLLTVSRLRCN